MLPSTAGGTTAAAVHPMLKHTCALGRAGEPALPLAPPPPEHVDAFGRGGRRAAAHGAIDEAVESLAPHWPVLGGLRRPVRASHPFLLQRVPMTCP